MAFFRKAGSLLGRTASTHMNREISSSKPSVLQLIRCMSSSKLFIGGLSYSTDDTSLREAFDKYGEVVEARVIVDRETGRSRGFGFVTYSSSEEASAAIQALDQQELHGRSVRVNYANDRTRGYGGGGFRGGNFGGGGGFGSGGGGGYGGNYGGGGYGGSGGGYSGNYGGGGSYGGNYGGGAQDPAGDGNNFGGNNYPSSNNYSGGNLSYGGDDQGIGGAGGAGGNNFFSSGSNSGYQGLDNKFGNQESIPVGGAGDGLSQDNPSEGNYRDNEDMDNYAERRAQ